MLMSTMEDMPEATIFLLGQYFFTLAENNSQKSRMAHL